MENHCQFEGKKIIFLSGEDYVGKTSLVLRYIKGMFNEFQVSLKLRAFFTLADKLMLCYRSLPLGQLSGHRLSAWTIQQSSSKSGTQLVRRGKAPNLVEKNPRKKMVKTPNDPRYDSLAPMYYRGAQVAIVVYDITNAGENNTLTQDQEQYLP